MQRSFDYSIAHQTFDIVKKTFSLSRTIALTSRWKILKTRRVQIAIKTLKTMKDRKKQKTTRVVVKKVTTTLEKTSTSISNKSKTSFLQSISSLFDIDENFTSKFSTQLKTFSSQTQNFQQNSNVSKSNFLQTISFNSISMKLCFELVTQSTIKEVIEISKSKICVNDLNFFDSTMLLNLFEFHLFNFSVCFIQKLDSTTRNYQAKSVLITLIRCLRDSIYIWFKTQLDFISLNNFKQTLIIAFSSSMTSISIDTITTLVSHSSSQYHVYSKCNAQFSSISRLLTHTQKVNCFKLACKHCEKDFNSNNKFHEHVRLKHVRRFVNSLKASRAFLKTFQSSILTFKTWQTSTFETSFTSFFIFLIVFKKFVETLRNRLKEKRSKHVKLSFTSSKSTILATLITSWLFRLFKLVQLSITFFFNSFASRASFKASQSSILSFKTWQTSTFDASSISFFTFSHMSSLSHYKFSI